MPPWQSASKVSSGKYGTRRSPSSTRIRMLPICGPLPWVMAIREQVWNKGLRSSSVSAVWANCKGMAPDSPGLVMALPPSAITSVSVMVLRACHLINNFLLRHGQCHDRLGSVQAVFRFVVHHRVRAINDLVRHLIAPISGQRMHVQSIFRSQFHALAVANPVLVSLSDPQGLFGVRSHGVKTAPTLGNDDVGVAKRVVHVVHDLELGSGAPRVL